MLNKLPKSALMLSCLALGAGPGAAAASQDNAMVDQPQRIVQSTQQQAPAFSDQKIDLFVDARERVIKIAKKWEGRVQNAQSQEEVTSLRQASQEEMIKAVKDTGLTVSEYNSIVKAAQRNPELRQQINEKTTR